MAETHMYAGVFVNSEPRMKYLDNGTAVCSFLGGNKPYYMSEGAPRPDSVEFVAWGKSAEALNQHVHKGDILNITSTDPIKCRGWQNDGEVVTRMSVRIGSWQWAPKPRTEDRSAPPVEDPDELPF